LTLDAESLCLVLSGTNEILLGDVSFCHFAAIQEGSARSPKAMPKFDFQLAPIPKEIDNREPVTAIEPPKQYEPPNKRNGPPGLNPFCCSIRHCDLQNTFVVVLESVLLKANAYVQFEKFELSLFLKVGVKTIAEVTPLTFPFQDWQVLIGEPLVFRALESDFLDTIAQMPRYAVLCVQLTYLIPDPAKPANKDDLSYMNTASIRVFTRNDLFNSRRHEVGVFGDSLQVPPHPTIDKNSGTVVVLCIPDFFAPVFYDKWDIDDSSSAEGPVPLSNDDEVMCAHIMNKNPLGKASNGAKGEKDEVRWIMEHISECFMQPALLPWYLQLIDMGRVNNVFWL
jgi:hypothetical protein